MVQTTINSGLPGGKGISAIISASLPLAVCYAFLIIALLLLAFFPSQKYLGSLAMAGTVCSILSLRDGPSLRQLFYGYFGFIQSRVEYTALVAVLFTVMVALFLTSAGNKPERHVDSRTGD